MGLLRLVLLLALGAAAACTPASAAAAPVVDDHVTLVRSGFPMPLAADAPVSVSRELVVRVTVVNVPGTPFARELRLHLENAGSPLAGATIASVADMRFMTHGPVEGATRETSTGSYAIALPIYMAGQWKTNVDIRSATANGSLELEIDVFE